MSERWKTSFFLDYIQQYMGKHKRKHPKQLSLPEKELSGITTLTQEVFFNTTTNPVDDLNTLAEKTSFSNDCKHQDTHQACNQGEDIIITPQDIQQECTKEEDIIITPQDIQQECTKEEDIITPHDTHQACSKEEDIITAPQDIQQECTKEEDIITPHDTHQACNQEEDIIITHQRMVEEGNEVNKEKNLPEGKKEDKKESLWERCKAWWKSL